MQQQVLTEWPKGRPGDERSMAHRWNDRILNYNPATKEVRRITVSTAVGALTTYSVLLLGIVIAVSSASADKAVIAQLFADAITNNPVTGGLTTPTAGATTCDVEYNEVGVAFNLSDTDDNIATSLVTAADAADPIGMGVVVVQDRNATGDDAWRRGRVPSTTALGAMVYECTPDEANDATYLLEIEWDEVVYGPFTYTSDSSGTDDEIVDALVAAIEAEMPTFSVSAAPDTADATKLILTSEIPGMPFKVRAWTDAPALDLWVVERVDTHGIYAEIDKCLLGVTVMDQRWAQTIAGQPNLVYPGQSPMTVRRGGEDSVCVRSQDAAPTVGAQVWVGVAAGFEGLISTTKSSGNYARTRRLEWDGSAGQLAGNEQGWVRVLKAA